MVQWLDLPGACKVQLSSPLKGASHNVYVHTVNIAFWLTSLCHIHSIALFKASHKKSSLETFYKRSTNIKNIRQLPLTCDSFAPHSNYAQTYHAVTVNDNISWFDSYDQFAEIFSSWNLQYPTFLLLFLAPKKSIGPMALSGCNMDNVRGVVLTQSAIIWTHRFGRLPFWLIVTALDRNCSLPGFVYHFACRCSST